VADKGDKTEKPTPKRLSKARKEGQIARTPELGIWVAVMVASFVIPQTVRLAYHNVGQLLRSASLVMANPDEGSAQRILGQGLATAALTVLPFALTMMGVGVATNLVQVRWAPTTKLLKPKFSRLNPATGFKRLASPQSLIQLSKTLVKLVALGLVTYLVMRTVIPTLLAPGVLNITSVAATVSGRALTLIRTVAGIGLLLAAVDYGIARRRTGKSLKMSRHEIREESKQSEGNPLIKGAQRKKMAQMSRLRMMAEAARADVIVVNPTHVAVALRYDAAKGAPHVTAKGADHLALPLRAHGEEHGVPIVEDVPLARTLWKACDVGDEIPTDLYEAVARLLAFVFALKRVGRHRTASGDPLRLPGGALR